MQDIKMNTYTCERHYTVGKVETLLKSEDIQRVYIHFDPNGVRHDNKTYKCVFWLYQIAIMLIVLLPRTLFT